MCSNISTVMEEINDEKSQKKALNWVVGEGESGCVNDTTVKKDVAQALWCKPLSFFWDTWLLISSSSQGLLADGMNVIGSRSEKKEGLILCSGAPFRRIRKPALINASLWLFWKNSIQGKVNQSWNRLISLQFYCLISSQVAGINLFGAEGMFAAMFNSCFNQTCWLLPWTV